MRRHSCFRKPLRRAGRDSRAEHAAAHTSTSIVSLSPLRILAPTPDPDIKGRWSETMKLQVRCQLPFETKHSPNPGKTQPVPGIRTNKEELKGRMAEERGGGGGFYGPCWQYGISIKGPKSALNYPPVLLSSHSRTAPACLGVWGCLVWEIGGERTGCR